MRISVKHRQVDKKTLEAHLAEMYERAGRAYEKLGLGYIEKGMPESAEKYIGLAAKNYYDAAENSK